MGYTGSLFIIAAASGTGKTSLANALAGSILDICISVSHTTRPMRFGEKENLSYFFVEKNAFEEMIAAKEFLEYAEVFGHYYGTSQRWVLEQLQSGKDVILDIDWQGAQKVRRAMPESVVSIFLLPPSRDILRHRLETRNRDSAEIVADRLLKADSEVQHYNEFDYLVINDNFDQALMDLKNIILAQRLKCHRQAVKHKKLLAEFLIH